MDLIKNFLPRPKTAAAWKLTPHRSKISKNQNSPYWVPLHRFFKNRFAVITFTSKCQCIYITSDSCHRECFTLKKLSNCCRHKHDPCIFTNFLRVSDVWPNCVAHSSACGSCLSTDCQRRDVHEFENLSNCFMHKHDQSIFTNLWQIFDVWPIALHGAAALAQTVDVVMFYEVPPPLAAPHFILSDH